MIQGKDAKLYCDSRGFTDREINWLWNFNQFYMQSMQVYYSDVSAKRKIIFEFFDDPVNGDIFYKKALSDKDIFLINENELKWAKHPQNEQLLIFTINMLIKFNNLIFNNLISISNYDYLLDIVDKLNLTNEVKLNQIVGIKNLWSNLKPLKGYTNWIDIKNIEQINWAWDYLKKNYKLASIPSLPINEKQRYNHIISSIDLMGFMNSPDAKELFLLKMKKTWSQKKFRDSGKIKKPHHLPLTKERHEQLKKLSGLFNKPIPDVLDFIIEKVYSECMTDNEGKLKNY